jgi:group I intron endonuclease
MMTLNDIFEIPLEYLEKDHKHLTRNCFGIIYIAFNKQTGKVYIGQTTKPLSIRISQHYGDTKRKGNRLFQNSLNKYSKDDWEWHILRKCKNGKELSKHEYRFILKYHSNALRFNDSGKTYGYNTSDGGTGRRGPASDEEKQIRSIISRKRWDDPIIRERWIKGISKAAAGSESRLKKSLTLTGKSKTASHTAHMKEYWENNPEKRIEKSQKMSGANHPFYHITGVNHPGYGKKRTEKTKELLRKINQGKIVSEETKQKISESKTGKYRGSNNPMYGKGYKLMGEKNGMYNKSHTEEAKQKMREKTLKQFIENHPRAIPIVVIRCKDKYILGKFDSKTEAWDKLDVSRKIFEKRIREGEWEIEFI